MCQYASLDVSDMMGTERQGITKDVTMMRIDADGIDIALLDYSEEALTYESVDDEEKEHPCKVCSPTICIWVHSSRGPRGKSAEELPRR